MAKDLNQIVRIVNVDLDGSKSIYHQLTQIRGVSFSYANLLCKIAGIKKDALCGSLDSASLKRIEEILTKPSSFPIPTWIKNRKRDPETGADMHLITTDLKFTQENDIKIMRKIRSYKGARHSAGLPVRGQRTKSNFRKNKGKVAAVQKKSAAPAAAPAPAAKGK